jgi:hypothetical protein
MGEEELLFGLTEHALILVESGGNVSNYFCG